MPTNILRSQTKPAPSQSPSAAGWPRHVLLRAGHVALTLDLLDTATALRLWTALPLFSTAETWGGAVHFETPIETGRERGARTLVAAGEIAYWTEEDRVIVGFGRTPISLKGEIRLPRPCNVWARSLDDVTLLASVQPGTKVSLMAAG